MKNCASKITIVLLCIAMTLSMTACGAGGKNDPKKELSRVELLMSKMTLEEKIAQMLMPSVEKWSDGSGDPVKFTEMNDSVSSMISDLGLGGMIIMTPNNDGTAQTTALVSDMQSVALKSRSGIPMFISVDQEGGYVYRLATGTSTCGNMALGAAGDTSLACENAKIIGSELNAEGFNIDFAPVMDVNSNPDNPVIGVRSFGDDPDAVAEFGAAFIEGLHSQNIISALKHFPGHGDTATDSHTGLPLVDKTYEEIEKCELVPFKKGIAAGAEIVMTAHIQYPQIESEVYKSISDGKDVYLPATLSKTILTGILREKLGFEGIICTDSMVMDAVKNNFDPLDAAELAINAGANILLIPMHISCDEDIESLKSYIGGIAEKVNAKNISEDRINDSVKRILSLKEKSGMLDITAVNKDSNIKTALSVVGSGVNHEKEWEITEKTITLVKNDDMLPIKLEAGKNAAFFVSYANEATCVEYAVSKLQNEGKLPEEFDYNVFTYTKEERLSDEHKSAILSAASVVISVESAKNWELSFAQDLIAFAHENGKKVALVCLQLPYHLSAYTDADALIVVYNCKGMNVIPDEYNGETKSFGPNVPCAFAAVLGGFSPSGKLPVEIPGLYERGFGLTY